MNEWEDYYQILQIHFMAEPEVIKGAYIKLCKKYHPDSNPAVPNDQKMKQINKAFEVLSDAIERKQYLVKWFERHNGSNHPISIKKRLNPAISFSTDPSKNVLIRYFNAIQNRHYLSAYELLSAVDQKNIAIEDYVHWLTLVAEVFELIRFECMLDHVYSEAEINNNHFLLVVQYQVTVVEKNSVMERVEEDTFIKNVIFEQNEWHVFLGYNDLESVIKKFSDLANLRKKKRYLTLKLKKGRGVNLLSRKEFLQQAEKEQNRMNRYGNVFSLILVAHAGMKDMQPSEKIAFNTITKGIVLGLRVLDIASLWKEGMLFILLPETNLSQSYQVIAKIEKKVQKTRQIKLYPFQQKYDSIRMLIKSIVKMEFEGFDD